MKKVLLLIICLGVGKLYAQRTANNYTTPNNNYNYNRVENYSGQVHLTDSIQDITADVVPGKAEPKIKNDRYYFWYRDKVIHSSQGGYAGQLLNGHYLALYPDKNLKEEGNFKSGLKDGPWKTWNRKGDLSAVTTWNEGIEVAGDQPIWKKIPFLNKKDAQPRSKEANN